MVLEHNAEHGFEAADCSLTHMIAVAALWFNPFRPRQKQIYYFVEENKDNCSKPFDLDWLMWPSLVKVEKTGTQVTVIMTDIKLRQNSTSLNRW